MADVYISYYISHREYTRSFAKELEEKGFTVWWDTDLIAENRSVNASSRSSKVARLPSLSGRLTLCTQTMCCPKRSALAQHANSFSCTRPTLIPVTCLRLLTRCTQH